VRELLLLAPAEGLMAPGTAKTVDMLVGVRDHDVRSMSCEARAL
jgi:hypothetical protein